MLKLSDHLYIPPMGRVLEEAAREKAEKQKAKRSYAAAKMNRLHSNWATQPTTSNWELRQSLAILRARARQQCRDNSHFKRFLSLTRSNIIGPGGIQLQCRARKANGTLDAKLNKLVEEAFWAWSMPENCTITQKMDWVATQNLAVTHLARDGEVLIAHLPAQNAFGYAVKVINVDYLDETYNQPNSVNGNRIIMSVEIDGNDKPVAYWLTTPPSDVQYSIKRERLRTRVPAENITHAFLVFDDEFQMRGVTWFHSALLDAKDLDGYKRGVITSARMTANWVGFIEQDAADDVMFTGEEDEEGHQKNLEIDNSPGQFNLLEPGMKVNHIDPKQPTQQYAEFYKKILTDLGAGLDIPYFQLSGDLEGVNFTSSRVGLIDSRDIWKALQKFVGMTICRPVYHHFIDAAIMSGQLVLNPRQYAEVQNPMWRGRGWQYVQPREEVNASVMGLQNNLTSLTQELSERGIDIVDHFETIKAERELAAEYGIELDYVTNVNESETETPETDKGGDDANANDQNTSRELTNGHGFEHLN